MADDTFVEGIEQQQEEGTQTTETVETTPAKTEGQPDLTAALAELTATMRGTRAEPKTQERAPTQDEIDSYWAIYNPEKENPDFFKKFFRMNADATPEEAKAAYEEYKKMWGGMQTGLVRQAVVGSRNLFQQELEKVRAEYGPLLEYVNQQKAEQTKTRFYDSYSSLNEPQYQTVVNAMAQQLAQQTFKNEAEYFKALAEGAAGAIKGLIPTFDLGAKKQTKTAVTSPRLPRTSVGGTGGTGNEQVITKSKGSGDDDAASIPW